MAHDWKTSLTRDREYHWWTGWVKVPSLAEIGADQEGQAPDEDHDVDAEQETDEEVEAELAAAESMLDDMMKTFTDPDAMMGMVKMLNPNLDPDAIMPGSGGKTLRQLMEGSAEQCRRIEAGEMADEIEAENARLDAAEAAERDHRADGELELILEVDEDQDTSPDAGADRDPTPAQLAAVEHLRANEARLRPTILQAIADHYLSIRDELVEFYDSFSDPDEIEEELPEEMPPDEVARRVHFSAIIVERREHDGLAYVRLDGGCSWEEEHGIGVTLHADRIVGVGHGGEEIEDEA